MSTTLRWGAATHEGQVRQNNEDSALVDDGANLFAVADGMGGHAAGEVASQVAVEALRANVGAADGQPSVTALIDGVRLANRAVFDRAGADPELRGMGTTLCALALVEEDGEERVAVVNVGDSRVYLLQQGELTRLTEDHSLVEDMVRQGQISAEEAKVHPQRNIVTRVLGIDADIEVDSWQITPYTGDRYLLCSDGLFDELEEREIAAILRRVEDPDETARELVRRANENGGRDNITCVVVDIADDGGRAREASAALAADAATARAKPVAEVTPTEPSGTAASSTIQAPAEASVPRAITDVHRAVEIPERADRPRRFTWRVALFVLVLLVLAGGIIGAFAWFARGTYFVGVDGDDVVIFKGRPGGLLWFDPTVEERTDLTIEDVRPNRRDDVEAGHEAAGLDEARRYVENLSDDEPSDPAGTTPP